MSALQIDDLQAGYGEVLALRGVSITVNPGEIVTIIGSNGAGKTTLLRTASGLLRARSGRIRFGGQDITHAPAHSIVHAGLVHVPEGRLILKKMSVRENLLAGAQCRDKPDDVARDLDAVLETFPRLRERFAQNAGTLSGGEQQMLAIARALMAGPRLLMLDEPSLGLAPLIVSKIFEHIAEMRARGLTILLVEQNARKALRIADRAYVLELGRVVGSGSSQDIARDEAFIRAYLGA